MFKEVYKLVKELINFSKVLSNIGMNWHPKKTINYFFDIKIIILIFEKLNKNIKSTQFKIGSILNYSKIELAWKTDNVSCDGRGM